MKLIEIFEKVNLIAPIEQRKFFNFYNDTIDELNSLYGNLLFQKTEDGEEYEAPTKLDDEVLVLPLYQGAIIDNILFLVGKGEVYKSEFVRKARNAYLKYWNDNAKGRRLKKWGAFNV